MLNFLKSIQVTILIKITEEHEAESAFLKNKNLFLLLFVSYHGIFATGDAFR